jgi:RimJ/RimL family protein N-acetyltransferase
MGEELGTERLLLRRWRESDLEPWGALNADPEVREYLGDVLTREQSDAAVAAFQSEFDQRGYGWWAVEVQATGEFVGFAGLDDVEPRMPVTGVEIGWRLARSSWGRGYATEAARAVLTFGFETLGLPEIFAITAAGNVRSQAVMQRLGMTHNPADDFEDSNADPNGPFRHHVIYRITR